jgi:diguanylate cyclase (GGDEF)-like protein
MSQWRFSTRVLAPILIAACVTVVFVTGVLIYAASESDRVTLERQTRLVSHILSEQYAKITRDQESTTIWDESILHTQGELDFDWLDSNLGVWLNEYFGHDRAYVLNAEDKPIYGMVDGARADPSSYSTAYTALAPMVKKLRRLVREATPDAEETPHVSDLVMIEARPAIASVVPIVSDTGKIEQEPGSERLHVSIRFMDGDYLQALMQQYLLEGARFDWNGATARDEAAYPLARKSGTVLGYFVWQPEQPGWKMLTQTAPVLAVAALFVAFVITLLVKRLRRASKELQASEAQAHHLAFHDALTGLPNRSLFNDKLDRALIEMRRHGAPLALLYLDLDRFKNVNDTLGHPAGDDLIRELAARLTALVRSSDCVARLGGDEFAILVTGPSDIREVEALSSRIIQSVAKPFEILGSAAFVGVSIGVAVAPGAGTDRAELVRKADIALYRAKLEGRNRFKIFSDEMDVFVQRRRAIEAELRSALAAGDQFRLVYQPLYAAASGEVVGAEALLRWQHPERGVVSPAIFIPIAEESGLIHAIGEWVLREACRSAVRWPIRRIAVNVSPTQFRSSGFAATVLQILKESGLQPGCLELEVTESVLLDSAEYSAQTFNALRAAGIRIALDDFGTGYSSLNYLHKYSVDKIKIDRSFVQNIDSDSAADAIVQAMVDLARAMGVEVTAEGVETAEQRDFLARIGCDELQGFLLSRPLTAEQMDRTVGRTETNAIASAA